MMVVYWYRSRSFMTYKFKDKNLLINFKSECTAPQKNSKNKIRGFNLTKLVKKCTSCVMCPMFWCRYQETTPTGYHVASSLHTNLERIKWRGGGRKMRYNTMQFRIFKWPASFSACIHNTCHLPNNFHDVTFLQLELTSFTAREVVRSLHKTHPSPLLPLPSLSPHRASQACCWSSTPVQITYPQSLAPLCA